MSHKENHKNHEQFSQHAELKVLTYNQSLDLYQMFPSTDTYFLIDFWAIFRSLHNFLFYTTLQIKKNVSKVLNTFKNVMENGAFAPKEQMLPLP